MECDLLKVTNTLLQAERDRSGTRIRKYGKSQRESDRPSLSSRISLFPKDQTISIGSRTHRIRASKRIFEVSILEENTEVDVILDLSETRHVLRKFFAVKRDAGTFGSYEETGYDGSDVQLYACLTKLMEDAINCVIKIVRACDDPQLYALWYRQIGCGVATEYQRYVTVVACNAIFRNDTWMDVESFFPQTVIESDAV